MYRVFVYMNGKKNYETKVYDNVDYISYDNGKVILVHGNGFNTESVKLLDDEVNRVEMIKMNALVGGSV